jgi:AraC family L-rhamnose operon transcriptional activator RhaR
MQRRDALRTNKARELLANTNRPIGQIANNAGWPDQLYFARRFKKAHGKSPRNYRKQLLSALQE